MPSLCRQLWRLNFARLNHILRTMLLIELLLVNYNRKIIKNDPIRYLLMFLAFRKVMRRHTGLLPARVSRRE